MEKLFLKLFSAFLFIIIGFVARRRKVLDERIARRMTRITTDILFPCLLFHTVYRGFKSDLLKEAGLLFFLAIGISVIGYFLGYIFASFLKMQDKMRRVFLLLSFKPASGLIGLPLCIILFGEESLLFAGPYAFGIGLIFYTLGLSLLKQKSFSWRTLISPISMTLVFSILLVLFKVILPEIALKPVRFFGIFAVPLMLILVGSIFGMSNFKSDAVDKKMFLVAFNKLIVSPVLILTVCSFLPLEPLAKKVAVLMAAIPSSMTASMWALRFDADYIWASSTALFVGILSIITISLFFWIIF